MVWRGAGDVRLGRAEHRATGCGVGGAVVVQQNVVDSGEVVTEKQIWLNVKARWVVRPVCGQCGLWENLVKNNKRAVGASATGVAGQNVCRRGLADLGKVANDDRPIFTTGRS